MTSFCIFILGLVAGFLLCLKVILDVGNIVKKEVDNGRALNTLNRTEAMCLIAIIPEDIWDELNKNSQVTKRRLNDD